MTLRNNLYLRKMFQQIAQHLGLNLRFEFEFGELQRYETLLDYQVSSNRSRPYL